MPSVQTRQMEQADVWMSMEPEYWDPKGPIIEALRLLALLETGDTVDDVRRLIEVPPDIEASLRAFIVAHPEKSFEIEYMLTFRREVAMAFERFVSMYFVDKGESLTVEPSPKPQRCLGEEMTLLDLGATSPAATSGIVLRTIPRSFRARRTPAVGASFR